MSMSSRLAEELRRAMEASSLPRNQIARLSKVNKAALSRLASGERELSLESAEKVAEALGLEITLRRRRRGKGN